MTSKGSLRRYGACLTVALLLGACGADTDDRPGAGGGSWSMAETDLSSSYQVTNWSDSGFEASGMAFLPDGRALLITKGGWGGSGVARVELLDTDGSFIRTVLELPVCTDAERGLMNIAVDPQFEQNSLIYLFYTRDMSGCAMTEPDELGPIVERPVWNRMSTFVFDEDAVDPASERVILDELPGHQGSHNSGSMAFLADGTMLVTVGEAKFEQSRDVDFVGGKVLRVDVRAPDVAPEDNPFNQPGASDVAKLVYASGLRNMFHLAVDPTTQLVVGGDVGTDTFEEVNVVTAGADFGFPTVEGPGGNDNTVEPTLWYRHEQSCAAVIGGQFVDPTFVPGASGAVYTFTDFGCGGVWALAFDQGAPTHLYRLAPKLEVSASALVTGPDNALYLIGVGPGAQPVRRLALTG